MLDLPSLLAPLKPLLDILASKYFGIPLVLYIIGFTHLAIMVFVLFGQAAIELVLKKKSK